jgi:hypothetical protein
MTMYHGTSDVFLSDILKHGLLADPPNRTYNDTSGNIGYETYGGVYLTHSLSDAKEAAMYATDVAGGDTMIVQVQYVMGSGNIDEDRITFVLNNIVYDIYYDYQMLDSKDSFETYIQANMRKILDKHIDVAMTRLSTIGRLGIPVRAAVENVIKLVLDVVGETEIHYQNIMTVVVRYPAYKRYVELIMRNITATTPSDVQLLRNIGFKGKTRITNITDSGGDVLFNARSQ